MTDTIERTATKTIRNKRGVVTVTAKPAGWTITGAYTTWKGRGPAPVFEAEIARCPCDPEAPAPEQPWRRRSPQEPCACNRPGWTAHHQRFCHDWHLERVERLAEDIAKTYGKGHA